MNQFPTYTLRLRSGLIVINRPQVMGIMNVTPDSFYACSRMATADMVKARTAEMIAEGADMIDLGGYSSRPGADDVTVQQEIDRLGMAMTAIRSISSDIPVSIDTFRASVARVCINDMGADIVNDISGGDLDQDMLATVAELGVPYILMHMRGTPKDMQQRVEYDDVVTDVAAELGERIVKARQLGVADLIVDPGFGFSKTTDQCFELLGRLSELRQILDLPMLVGLSRKSMIYKTLDTDPAGALNGTTVVNTIALQQGASILRVHDVRQAAELVKLIGKITEFK
ncbi:MAG: dihydropteroate synthase [Barnesiella sp.]|nr:dihydropteroate synthase [Barnesiella sp.]